jgi:hypothetical protein
MAGPLQFTEVEIPLGEGPDEKTAKLLRAPGILRAPLNVDNRTSGMIRKRRGYTRPDITENLGVDIETQYHNLGQLQGELVLVGSAYLYSLISVDAAVSNTVVRRGPVMRGGYAIEHVITGNIGSEL